MQLLSVIKLRKINTPFDKWNKTVWLKAKGYIVRKYAKCLVLYIRETFNITNHRFRSTPSNLSTFLDIFNRMHASCSGSTFYYFSVFHLPQIYLKLASGDSSNSFHMQIDGCNYWKKFLFIWGKFKLIKWKIFKILFQNFQIFT